MGTGTMVVSWRCEKGMTDSKSGRRKAAIHLAAG